MSLTLEALSSFFMNHLHIVDLKSARLQAGLLQSDCAHFLGVSVDTYSHLETGKRQPKISEVCALTLIFGQQFESLFRVLYKEVRRRLRARLKEMPDAQLSQSRSERREATLGQLREYLSTLNALQYEA